MDTTTTRTLPAVKPEHSNWRDEDLSARHRHYGWDCCMCDVDELCYDAGIPKAILEYKTRSGDYDSANYRAIRRLGDMAGLPVFDVLYATGDWQRWYVTPLNDTAREILPAPTLFDTERAWVEFHYRLRGRPLPDDVEFDEAGAVIISEET